MPRILESWKVLPHGKLSRIGERIMTVTGEIRMPLMTFPRRMTVARLKDRGLVIFSAVALDEVEMGELEDFGRPAFLVVPNDHHRMDAAIWKARYPWIRVVAPAGGAQAIGETVPVDSTRGDFGDAAVRFVTVPGTHARESALEVNGAHGMTLVLNDLIGNIHGERGVGGFMLRRLGFAGETAHVPTSVKYGLIADKPAVAAQLRRWADREDLVRILVSHGDIIEQEPRRVLRELAESLD